MLQLHPEESWFVTQVIPRHEKSVDTILGIKCYQHFLPIHRARRKWSDRTKVVDEPLFPGYVFVRVKRSLMGPILGIPGVIRIVSFGGVPHPISEEEIEALRLVFRSSREVCSFPYLNVGQNVRVISGPLSGIRGIVTKFKKHDRLILSIDLIMKSVSVEINGSEIEPIESKVSTL
jgi:transcriptional antiterminator NusG